MGDSGERGTGGRPKRPTGIDRDPGGVGADQPVAHDDPHHVLNNPATDPDPTEYPDPYERRADPRDPATVDTPAFPAEEMDDDERRRSASPKPPSTSEPHPPINYDDIKPEKGEG